MKDFERDFKGKLFQKFPLNSPRHAAAAQTAASKHVTATFFILLLFISSFINDAFPFAPLCFPAIPLFRF